MQPLMLPGFSGPSREQSETGEWSKRWYQLETKRRFFELVDQRHYRAPIVVLPTGTGKTYTAGTGVIKQWLADKRGPVVWLAHLNTLIEQTRESLGDQLGEYIGLEQGNSQWNGERVCVASTASLYRPDRIRRIAKRPTLVCFDEVHHYAEGENLKLVRTFKESATLFGFTATPIRADGISLKSAGFDSLALNYELRSAIHDGYLVPITAYTAIVPGLDFDRLTRAQFTDKAVGALMSRESVLNTIVKKTFETIGNRITAAFFPTVEVAHLMASLYNAERPGVAMAVDGTKMAVDTKRGLIKKFKAGGYQIACNVGVLAEGFDYPGISCVLMANPTESLTVYMQCMGRGTRNVCKVDNYDTPAERRAAIALSTKSDLLVVDFVGNTTNKKLKIKSVIDCLAGSDVDEETRDRAKEKTKAAPGNAEEALDEAAREISNEREEKAKRAREAGTLDMELHRVDVFDESEAAPTGVGMKNALDVPDPELLEYLKGQKIKTDGISGQEAKRLRREVYARRKAGLSSFPQIAVLASHKIDGKPLYAVQASAVIDLMAKQAKAANRRYWAKPNEFDLKAVIAESKPKK